MSNCCPVQNSLTRHLNDLDESEALDIARDDYKEAIMNKPSLEFVIEAICDFTKEEDDGLWQDIISASKSIHTSGLVDIDVASDIVRGLYHALYIYAERQAFLNVNQENGNDR